MQISKNLRNAMFNAVHEAKMIHQINRLTAHKQIKRYIHL